MESALINHNPHWVNNAEVLFERDILPQLLSKIHLRQIHVLKGLRRSGKTTLFKLIIQHLTADHDPKKILYVNLDDPFFTQLYQDSKHLYRLLELSQKLTGEPVEYLFLDEVQNVTGWEKFIKSIYDNQVVKKIFITGSNSSLMEGEYATLLSGRYIADTVYPFNFREALRLNNINTNLDLFSQKALVLSLVDQMMEYGSFYEVLEEATHKRDIILGYYSTLLLKDCVANNELRDAKTFKEIAHFAISNSTNLYSYNSLARAVNSNDGTVKEYLRIMEDAYLATEIKAYAYSMKEQMRSQKKLYINDNSFLAQTSFKFSKDSGKLFENLVFTELTKAAYDDVYYYNKGFECDFIARQGSELHAFQVCYELNPLNIERELAGLQKLPIKVDKKTLVIYDQPIMGLPEVDGIEIIPFYELFSRY